MVRPDSAAAHVPRTARRARDGCRLRAPQLPPNTRCTRTGRPQAGCGRGRRTAAGASPLPPERHRALPWPGCGELEHEDRLTTRVGWPENLGLASIFEQSDQVGDLAEFRSRRVRAVVLEGVGERGDGDGSGTWRSDALLRVRRYGGQAPRNADRSPGLAGTGRASMT